MSQIQEMCVLVLLKDDVHNGAKQLKLVLTKLLEPQRLAGLEQARMLNKTPLMAIISCPVHTGYHLTSLCRLLFGLNIFSYFYVPEKNENSRYAWDKMPIAQEQQAAQNNEKNWQFLRLNIICEENCELKHQGEKKPSALSQKPHYL